jgi:hypothetical protein
LCVVCIPISWPLPHENGLWSAPNLARRQKSLPCPIPVNISTTPPVRSGNGNKMILVPPPWVGLSEFGTTIPEFETHIGRSPKLDCARQAHAFSNGKPVPHGKLRPVRRVDVRALPTRGIGPRYRPARGKPRWKRARQAQAGAHGTAPAPRSRTPRDTSRKPRCIRAYLGDLPLPRPRHAPDPKSEIWRYTSHPWRFLTLDPRPLDLGPWTLDHSTLDPGPLDPRPWTLDPSTLDPRPWTLDPGHLDPGPWATSTTGHGHHQFDHHTR